MNPLLIDTHAHVNFNAYKDDSEEVIARSLSSNVWMINVGSQSTTSARAVRMAEQYEEGVYAAIGIQPIHLIETEMDEEEIYFKTREERFDSDFYQGLIDGHLKRMRESAESSDSQAHRRDSAGEKKSKIVAMGEIGLEYYRLEVSAKDMSSDELKAVQKEALLEQMGFACKNNLPLILHCRGSESDKFDAYRDLLDILDGNKDLLIQGRPGTIHCFVAEDMEIVDRFMDLGFYIGLTGIVTFGRNADKLREIVKQIPLDKMLVETDCPYLAPAPHRGKRNEPAYVELVAGKIAEVKGVQFEEVAEKTTENARRLFNI